MANKVDIAFHIGSTWELMCDCYNVDRTPVQISKAEWRLASSTARLVKATSDGGEIEITNPGQCLVVVPEALQVNLVAGTYEHELWVLDDQGIGSVQIIGTATIVQSLRKRFP